MGAMQHVLVVDDDADIRETLAHRLANEGYSVDVARDGAEALAQLSEGCSPDAIVLDLGMPTMNGWQFRDLQKRNPRLAEIPVVVMTGQAPLGIDVQHVLVKPFAIEHLVATIRRITVAS
jgi:CheY-like chemotaxis protein